MGRRVLSQVTTYGQRCDKVWLLNLLCGKNTQGSIIGCFLVSCMYMGHPSLFFLKLHLLRFLSGKYSVCKLIKDFDFQKICNFK